jgi:predicted O-linked N-acetylglucosamine transferase (SPINDLY family)
MHTLLSLERFDLDAVMARATRWHRAPHDGAAALAFAQALASRSQYRHAAAVLTSSGATESDPAAAWLNAHLLLADGACAAAFSALQQAEAVQALSIDQNLIAGRIEIGAGDPGAALVRMAALTDADPRAAALFAEAQAWFETPDQTADWVLSLPPQTYPIEAMASAIGMVRHWAAGDQHRLHQCLSMLHTHVLARWALPLLTQLGDINAGDGDQEWTTTLAVNRVSVLMNTASYSRASTVVIAQLAEKTSTYWELICSYARFLAPMSEQISGVALRQVQETALAALRAAAAPVEFQHPVPRPLDGRRLRLGVLTRWYASLFFFNPPIYRDRDRIDVTAFVVNLASAPTGPAADREAPCYDAVLYLSELDDGAIAQAIKDHQIDILLDLTGQGVGERGIVLEWRPAPIQVAWTTKLSTTGSRLVDWFLADAALVPPEHDDHFTERVWRYPQIITPWQSSHDDVAPAPPPRHQTGLISFGTPASIFKISDAAISTWHAIVARVPRSRFIYSAPTNTTDETAYLYDRFVEAGFRCDQVVVLNNVRDADLKHLLNHIDIALDTFPFGCNRTAAECLEQGVPLLTTWGDRLTGRYTATQLQALGLDALIATDRADYIDRAVALAHDGARLDHWRHALPEQVKRSAIVDPQRAMRTLETALFGMWDEYVARSAATA